jgi:hypothetical protein
MKTNVIRSLIISFFLLFFFVSFIHDGMADRKKYLESEPYDKKIKVFVKTIQPEQIVEIYDKDNGNVMKTVDQLQIKKLTNAMRNAEVNAPSHPLNIRHMIVEVKNTEIKMYIQLYIAEVGVDNKRIAYFSVIAKEKDVPKGMVTFMSKELTEWAKEVGLIDP